MFHWDGYQWRQSLLPVSKDSHDEPEFMAFASPTKGWVVGGGERQANLYGLIFEWNGHEWTRQEIPDMGGFWGIDVAAPTDGWMAQLSSYLWRWNGKEWKRDDAQTFPDDMFISLSMVSTSDGWMERYSPLQIATFWHWDGTMWRESQQLQPAYYSATMVKSDFGWAVGQAPFRKQNYLMHWDGKTWSDYPIDADVPLFYVRAKTVDDGWIWGGDTSWDNSTLTAGRTVFRYRLISAAAPAPSATASASPTASLTLRPAASATATPVPPTATPVTLTPTPLPLTPTSLTPTLPLASASLTPTAPLSTTRIPKIPAQWVALGMLLILVVGGTMAVVYRGRRG